MGNRSEGPRPVREVVRAGGTRTLLPSILYGFLALTTKCHDNQDSRFNRNRGEDTINTQNTCTVERNRKKGPLTQPREIERFSTQHRQGLNIYCVASGKELKSIHLPRVSGREGSSTERNGAQRGAGGCMSHPCAEKPGENRPHESRALTIFEPRHVFIGGRAGAEGREACIYPQSSWKAPKE